MGKVFYNKVCDICGLKKPKVVQVWGKLHCPECFEKRPKTGIIGNSGMIANQAAVQQRMLAFDQELKLQRTTKGNKIFATLYLEHYPESKGIVGRQCNYLIERGGEVLGIIGANSPALNYKIFTKFFPGYTELNWLNNNVFRLVHTEKNLGTKILKMFRERVKIDYEKRYRDELVGLVTFVEPPRTGAVYKADNWTYLGETQGVHVSRRGSLGKWRNKEWSQGTKKHIYAKWIINRSLNVR